MQVLSRPWGAMHYCCDGAEAGFPVVFANSLGTDLRLWDRVLPLLPAGLRRLRYDKRGHGLSDTGPEEAVTLEDLAQDVIALIEAEAGGRPVVFVGLSIGGLIAQAVAAIRPDLIRALVLSNTAAKLGTAQSWQARIDAIGQQGLAGMADGVMERWFAPAFRATPALAPWRNMLTRTTEAGYVAACGALAGADQTEATAALRLPVLVIAGGADGASPPEIVRATADLIPGARWHLIPDAGHLPCVETPEDWAAAVAAFLQEYAR